jgi:hypothetical protein
MAGVTGKAGVAGMAGLIRVMVLGDLTCPQAQRPVVAAWRGRGPG